MINLAGADDCDDFIRKPFAEDEIFEMLNKHLSIEFLYEEQVPKEELSPITISPGADLSPKELAAIPQDVLSALNRAAIEADLAKIYLLIDQIDVEQSEIAEQLKEMANNFEYQKITSLIGSTRGGG